jgi:predicted secreted hydrolase
MKRVHLSLLTFSWLTLACQQQATPPPSAVSLSGVLGSGAGAPVPDGYARAYAPRPFVLPADHGPHPAFRNEWWYLTGNLLAKCDTPADGQLARQAAACRRFGFQITFFRARLTPQPVKGASRWRSDTVWMGHFALTDVSSRQHRASERFARDALGLAGAAKAPIRIWLHDWELRRDSESTEERWRLVVRDDKAALDLQLQARKPVVLQGTDGLSQKSAAPGNASYYYSLTRMRARGTVRFDNDSEGVVGSAWFDREWSTSALGPEQVGWDWFALQLDDGRELMYYRMRRRDGKPSRFSRGVLVGVAGDAQHFGAERLRHTVLQRWTARDGTAYPSKWRLQLPGQLDLRIVPVVADQEMRLSFRYWEGAVDVLSAEGKRIGWGYVELTGYDTQSATASAAP